jgi:hypothetical protein
MRTTVDLEPELIQNLTRLTGERSLNRAVNKALKEYVRRQRLEGLRDLLGTLDLDLDDWYEFRHAERSWPR